jgi:hypothetical protein
MAKQSRKAAANDAPHFLQLWLDELRGGDAFEPETRDAKIVATFMATKDKNTKLADIWRRLARRYRRPADETAEQSLEWLRREQRRVLPVFLAYLPMHSV